MSTKLTKALIRSELPEDVRDYVLAQMSHYRTRRVKLELRAGGEKFYFAEGARLRFFYAGRESQTIAMQAQHSLHAGGHKTSYRVGQYAEMAAGTWIVESELFLGKPFITVHHFGVAAIPSEV